MVDDDTGDSLTILETSRISPPPNSVADQSLPLTFFDLAWLLFHPVHQLYFYDFPHPKSHFTQTIIPNLKHSLSLTLQHFFPFAGNLIVFPIADHSSVTNKKPEIRYVEGDSLSLTFAESTHDFNDLKGNHPRDCNKFHPLVPLLEGGSKASGFVKLPIFSLQVTFFANSGISIGLTNHHTLCDASTRYDFLKAWTSIAKHGTDELFLSTGSLPFYDRVINYPNSLDESILNIPVIKNLDENYQYPRLVHQTNRVRATLVLTRTQLVGLKDWVLGQLPDLRYLSSFTVGCAYVWSCIAKSRVHVEGKKGEFEIERFTCVADWRSRLIPPVPPTYFGNCVGPCFGTTKTTSLTGERGFVTAIEVLGKGIRDGVKNKEGVFIEAEAWLEKAILQVPTVGVAGTPKLNAYDVDFGWGKPEKYETVSLDFSDSISVNASKESAEDLEIGLSLPGKQMDAFIIIFQQELSSILCEHDN